jgi:hypothetical protein
VRRDYVAGVPFNPAIVMTTIAIVAAVTIAIALPIAVTVTIAATVTIATAGNPVAPTLIILVVAGTYGGPIRRPSRRNWFSRRGGLNDAQHRARCERNHGDSLHGVSPDYSADFIKPYAHPNEREDNERERSAELRIKFWTDCGQNGTA